MKISGLANVRDTCYVQQACIGNVVRDTMSSHATKLCHSLFEQTNSCRVMCETVEFIRTLLCTCYLMSFRMPKPTLRPPESKKHAPGCRRGASHRRPGRGLLISFHFWNFRFALLQHAVRTLRQCVSAGAAG